MQQQQEGMGEHQAAKTTSSLCCRACQLAGSCRNITAADSSYYCDC